MKLTPDTPKPLKILTIDGGGLQAITTLLILDKLLDAIAKNNKVSHQKPRPCDVFDTIAGIGAGGWLAILLGRFHMDITACLSEWYKITSRIAPKSKSEEMRMRLLQHCYFDPDRLIEQIDYLTRLYGTGEYLFADEADGVRTRHVFVAALKSDSKGYNLFRSYEIPKTAKMPEKLLEGPENPSHFRISRAFGVTGAAKYFTPPWKEQMATSGKIRFSDNKFPKPHNITELALDEMWGLYGTTVPLSVVVNIGPGLTDPYDVKHIARRFSWGLSLPLHNVAYPKRPRSPPLFVVGDAPLAKKRSRFSRKSSSDQPKFKRLTVRFADNEIQQDMASALDNSTHPVPRYDTFGSIKDRKIDDKLRRLESKIEEDIMLKLDNVYGEGSGLSLYYRLAPEKSPQGTALNDSEASGVCLDKTKEYLGESNVKNSIEELVQLMPDFPESAERADGFSRQGQEITMAAPIMATAG